MIERKSLTHVLEANLNLLQVGYITDQKTLPKLSSWLSEKPNQDWVCDAKNLVQFDSSTIALFIHWLRIATQFNSKLTFTNLPTSLISLCDVYGVKHIIPIYSSSTTA